MEVIYFTSSKFTKDGIEDFEATAEVTEDCGDGIVIATYKEGKKEVERTFTKDQYYKRETIEYNNKSKESTADKPKTKEKSKKSDKKSSSKLEDLIEDAQKKNDECKESINNLIKYVTEFKDSVKKYVD